MLSYAVRQLMIYNVPSGVHHRRKVCHTRAEFALRVLLPSDCRRLLQLSILHGGVHDTKAAAPRAVLGVAPAEDANGRGVCGVKGTEVSKKVAERPAGVGWLRGWI